MDRYGRKILEEMNNVEELEELENFYIIIAEDMQMNSKDMLVKKYPITIHR